MAGITFEKTPIPGLLVIDAPSSADARGSFTKTFVAADFLAAGVPMDFTEEYYTVSARGVVRGMHFQVPPRALDKTVFCVGGTVFDVVLDLRRGSPTYLEAETFTLAEGGAGLYIPSGCAHGFAATSERACLTYKVTCDYSASHDTGILWSSIPVEWPVSNPIVSERDAAFVPMADFDSPFHYEPARTQE